MIHAYDIKNQYPSFVTVNKDPYNAYHITAIEPIDNQSFLDFIKQLLQTEIQLNKEKPSEKETTSIWVHLQPPKLGLVSQLCDYEFQIHKGKGKKIDVKRWIAKRKDLVPPFSEFYIGCGAVIIRNNCIFLVQQKSGQKRGRFNIPGGRADPGQLIHECAVRQLYEQTNMRGEYKYVLNFRQIDHNLFDSVDVYFPCYVEVTEEQLANLKLCDKQIKDYRWVPLDQYYQFTVKNSGITQVWLAECITKAWKNGFDFKTGMPNLTTFSTTQVGKHQAKISYHQLIPSKGSSK